MGILHLYLAISISTVVIIVIISRNENPPFLIFKNFLKKSCGTPSSPGILLAVQIETAIETSEVETALLQSVKFPDERCLSNAFWLLALV